MQCFKINIISIICLVLFINQKWLSHAMSCNVLQRRCLTFIKLQDFAMFEINLSFFSLCGLNKVKGAK